MKLLVGVDSEGHCRSALSLLARLKLSNPDLTLLYADEHEPARFSHGSAQTKVAELTPDSISQSYELALDRVSQESCAWLQCHGEVAHEGAVRCLFATDHSAHADRAFCQFLELAPAGISEVIVFTALEPTTRLIVGNLHRHLADSAGGIHDAREVSELSAELAARIESFGISATSRLRTGHVGHLIDAAMKETHADLLVLGSQGRGASGKRSRGSVVTAIAHLATYPILVLTPQ